MHRIPIYELAVSSMPFVAIVQSYFCCVENFNYFEAIVV